MITNRMLAEMSQENVAVIADSGSSTVDRLRILLAEEEQKAEFKKNVKNLLTGNVNTPTELAVKLNDKGLLKVRKGAQEINKLLIEGGYQTKDTQTVTLRGVTREITSYVPTEVTVECNLGVTQTNGATKSVRWDDCMVGLLLDLAIASEEYSLDNISYAG